MTPTIYSLRIVFKKAMNTLLHKPDMTDPRQRINPYITDLRMDKIDPEMRVNPYGSSGRVGVAVVPGMNIPGVTNHPREQTVEQPQEIKKQVSFATRIKALAADDITQFFDRIYRNTGRYKKLQRKKADDKSKREQFERLARGER